MSFERKFKKHLHREITDLRTLYRKGGTDKRHHNAQTSPDRLHQTFIPDIHRADATKNNAVEHLRKASSGSHLCSNDDLIHIMNTYIKQGNQEPCNINNVSSMADTHLNPSKMLGTTGISIVHIPSNNTYMLKK